MVVLCKQSRWAEVEFLLDICVRGVVPRLDSMLASLGIPVVLESNNGPPFNVREVSDFRKCHGLSHQHKTPVNPQVNGKAEQFMRILTEEVIPDLPADGGKLETRIVLLPSSIPSSTTMVVPADIIFLNRRFHTES